MCTESLFPQDSDLHTLTIFLMIKDISTPRDRMKRALGGYAEKNKQMIKMVNPVIFVTVPNLLALMERDLSKWMADFPSS